MFGSTAFLVRGKMCLSGRAERMMCRVDPALHDAVLKRKGCQTVVMRGREYRGYVWIDAAALKSTRSLRYWIDLALEYNNRI